MKVSIAGVGMISAIGENIVESLQSIESEKSGIGPFKYLETVHQSDFPAGEVKQSNKELAEISKAPVHLSRTALLSLIAAREALTDAEIENVSSLRTGFISANSVGGMDKSEKFFSEFLRDHNKGSLRDVVNHESGKISEIVAPRSLSNAVSIDDCSLFPILVLPPPIFRSKATVWLMAL